jgi:hypothetical protein
MKGIIQTTDDDDARGRSCRAGQRAGAFDAHSEIGGTIGLTTCTMSFSFNHPSSFVIRHFP